jgi:hypothetical protein
VLFLREAGLLLVKGEGSIGVIALCSDSDREQGTVKDEPTEKHRRGEQSRRGGGRRIECGLGDEDTEMGSQASEAAPD